MFESFVTLMPAVELGAVSYLPHAILSDPATPPMVRVELGYFGSGISLTITDARALFAGLGDALAAHEHSAAAVKAVA